MSDLADEMHDCIVLLAGPRTDGDNLKSMLARAARRADISYRQARAFFYREASNPRAWVIDAVRTAALSGLKPIDVRGEVNELARLQAENALLRELVYASLARAPRAPVAEAERGNFEPEQFEGSQAHRPSMADRTLAEAYGVEEGLTAAAVAGGGRS